MPAPIAVDPDKPATKARGPRKGKIVTPITLNKIKPAEYMRNVFAATVPPSVSLEDIQKGSYWVNIAKTLNVSDRIEVISEDGTFFAELFVTSRVLTSVRVKLIRSVDLVEEEAPVEEESELEVKYRGQVSKHAVQNKVTKAILQDGFATNEEAKLFLLNHETMK